MFVLAVIAILGVGLWSLFALLTVCYGVAENDGKAAVLGCVAVVTVVAQMVWVWHLTVTLPASAF